MDWIQKLVLVALVASGADSAAAQAGYRIEVMVKGTGEPIRRAEVRSGTEQQFTDPDGVVEFDRKPEADLTISRGGYADVTITLDEFVAEQPYQVYLERTSIKGNLVTIRGSRRTNVSKKTVSVEETENLAPSGDPLQIVKLLPGAQSQPFGSQIIVRGSAPSDSVYYIDDLEVPFIYHGVGDISVIPPEFFQKVEYDAGGFGVQYGNATGGVIVAQTTDEVPDRPRTVITANFPTFSGVMHERPLAEDKGLYLNVRQSYIEYILEPILEQQASSVTVVPHFRDFSTMFVDKEDDGHFKTSLIAAEDGVRGVFPAEVATNDDGTAEFSSKVRFATIGLERLKRFNRDWKLKTTPQFYWFNIDQNFFGNTVGLDVYRARLPAEATMRLSKEEDLFFGIDASVSRADVDIFSIPPNFQDPTFDPEEAVPVKSEGTEYGWEIAMHAGIDQQFGGLKVTPGIRASKHKLVKKPAIDPRVRARYQINDIHTIKGAVGQYSKAPEAIETSNDLGSKDLDYENNMHYVLGFESSWNNDWSTDLQVFYKNSTNLVVSTQSAERYANTGHLDVYGAEIFVRKNLTDRVLGWLSYTYSKALAKRDADQALYTSDFDQTHNINLVASYKLTPTFDFGGRFNYLTGKPYSPISSAIYNSDLDKYAQRRDDKDINTERLPDGYSVTAYASKDFLFNTWKMILKFGVEGFNHEGQVLNVNYNYNFKEKEYVRNIIAVPFIELRGEL